MESLSIKTTVMEHSAILAFVLGTVLGCQNPSTRQTVQVSATSDSVGFDAKSQMETVLLRGRFERVSRAVSGVAELVRHGDSYELWLSDVSVASDTPVRVYLVGHERPSSTVILDSVELKYDMAELEKGKVRQRIELPSEPDARLRSVVLYSPTYGVNLGFAALHTP